MASAGAQLATAFVQIVPTMKGVGKAITSAFQNQGSAAGTKAGNQLGSSVQDGFIAKTSGIAGAVKAAFAAAAGSAVVAFGKQALDAYATYEQAIGGVQTLFKDAANDVAQNASQAFKTAGMSTNEYMNTVTSFAAAMTSSLGGNVKESARLSDMAIRDMSDNANKMGTSMNSIVQTYQSLSRGNYAMLDNLKLGYGGTKSELERLLKDASKLPAAMGKKFDISNFSDVVTAIHLVQENMGITGTTAREAATTIEGSVASMKAAWSNWLTGLGRSDADLAGLSGQLVESVVTVGKNIAPRIVQIIKGTFSALPAVFSGLGGELSKSLSSALGQVNLGGVLTPQINSMIIELTQRFDILKQSLSNAWKNIQLVFTGSGLFDKLAADAQYALQAVIGVFDNTADTVVDVWTSITNSLSNLGFLSSITSVLGGLADGLTTSLQGVSAFVQPVVSSVGKFVSTLVNAVTTSKPFQDFLNRLGPLFGQISGFIRSVLGPFGQWVSMIIDFVTQSGIVQTAVNAIGGVLSWLVSAISGIMSTVQTVWNFISPIISQALALILQVGSQIISNVQTVWNAILPVIQPVLNNIQAAIGWFSGVFSALWNGIWSIVGSVIQTVWSGIQNFIQGCLTAIQGVVSIFAGIFSGNWSQIWNGIKQVFTGIWNSLSPVVSTVLGILSSVITGGLSLIKNVWTASWNGLKTIFVTMWNGLTSTIRGLVNGIGNIFSGIKNTITHVFAGAGNWLADIGRNIIDGLVNGIKNAADAVGRAVSGIANGIPDAVKKVLGIHSPSRVMRDMVGVYIPQGLAAGIAKGAPSALNAITQLGEDVSKAGTFSASADYTSQFTAGKNTAVLDYAPNTHSEERAEQLISLLSYYLPIIVRGQETNLTQRDLKRLSNGLSIL